MAKKDKTPFGIFTESVGLYFSNFDKFLKYMTFPVLGQILGLSIIFGFMYIYMQNMPKFIDKYPNLSDLKTLIIFSIIITLPGLAIFCKAFWEYLVAYGAVNSMLDNMIKSGKVYDFKAHNELIQRRSISFVGLWLIIGLFTLIAIFPLFWVICGIAFVYMILIFQVFTYEQEQTPIGCIKRSFSLVKGHFGSTFLILFLTGLLTYILIPQIFVKILSVTGFTNYLSGTLFPLANMLPDLNLEMYGLKPLTSPDIAKFILETIIMQIIIQYTLPMRSIAWALWYKKLNNNSNSAFFTKSKKTSKRPSQKLMESTNKKYSKRKIDSNILKRAMEKDDD